jgi:hypothetical protein
LIASCAALVAAAGCGSPGDGQTGAAGTPSSAARAAAPDAPPNPARSPRPAPPRREFKPVQLSGAGTPAAGRSVAAVPREASWADPNSSPAFAALKDLQVVLGEWRGTTRRKFGDFNSLETARWKWDLLTDRSQPALVLETTGSPYFQQARLMYRPATRTFHMTATDQDGTERVYEGRYTAGPELVPGDDPDQLQRTFKLELIQVSPSDDRELARIVFNQQSNNRYLLELYERRGNRLAVSDIVANQRAGTSFALVDEGYGERTYIISEGLGTMTVSHNGRTYYVCCTGCQAAFHDNPEYWIAKALERGQTQDE